MVSTGNIKVELEGRGPLTLRPSDHIATGGEGSVYRANATTVKLYTDPKKMMRDRMPEKVKLLKALQHPGIAAPQGIVLDEKRQPIGLWMPYASGEPLARVFTTAFRQRTSFVDADANTLVDRMREIVRFTHGHQAIMVDPNELNWVVDLAKTGPQPYAIDVDSWAIGSWKTDVIMPSIRDWHTKGFTELSDWFAWGVVTFQIFTGIHPYKGNLVGYKKGDFEHRMKANASIFSPGIGLPSAVRDLKCIPGALLDWYQATFQQGERTMPPSPFDKGIAQVATAARTYRVAVGPTGSLVFEKLFERTGDDAIRIFPCGVVRLVSGTLIDLVSKRAIGSLTPRGEVIRVERGWILADFVGDTPSFSFVDDRDGSVEKPFLSIAARQFLRHENRLFAVGDDALVELRFMYTGRPLLAVGARTLILQPHATNWFDGVGIQEAFGATFMVVPFGERSCVTVRTEELDGLKPVLAKAGNRFVAVLALDKKGQYHKLEFVFTTDYASHVVRKTLTDDADLNLALLPKGVGATIEEDGELIIFVPTSDKMTKIKDKQIASDMRLANWEDQVVYTKNGAVWSVRMK